MYLDFLKTSTVFVGGEYGLSSRALRYSIDDEMVVKAIVIPTNASRSKTDSFLFELWEILGNKLLDHF
ncbi:hypothetical protein KC344_g68 [Hortaea werneckii]|nr:hypothetical protein KC344_g68 [Hortaea werneckii]